MFSGRQEPRRGRGPDYPQIIETACRAIQFGKSADEIIDILKGIATLAQEDQRSLINAPRSLTGADAMPGLSLVARVTHAKGLEDVLLTFKDIGINKDQRFALVLNGAQNHQDCSLAHAATVYPSTRKFKILENAGVDFNVTNSANDLPLNSFIRLHPKEYQGLFQSILSLTDLSIPRKYRESPFFVAMMQKNLVSAYQIFNAGMSMPPDMEERNFQVIVSTSTGTTSHDFLELIKKSMDLTLHLSSQNQGEGMLKSNVLLDEAARLFVKEGNLYHFYLYLQSCFEVVGQGPKTNGTAFTRLGIAVTTRYKPSDISLLTNQIEWFNDHLFYNGGIAIDGRELPKSQPPDQHPSEAELLLLLAHPDVDASGFNLKIVEPLTKAATSPFRYIDYGVPTIEMSSWGKKLITNWQRLGQLTHGAFLPLRFDVQHAGGYPAIMEQFGFSRVHRSERALEKLYGPAYVLHPGKVRFKYTPSLNHANQAVRWFSPQTMVIFARGYLVVSNPRAGHLLVRNSSLVFGRNCFEHPAYYSKSQINNRNLIDLKPETVEEKFVSIFDRRINGVKGYKSRRPKKRFAEVMFLLEELTALTDTYNAWKFNTNKATAFEDSPSGEKVLTGAFNSPGFKHVVGFLDARFQEAEAREKVIVPELAFVHRFQPPWNPYTYKTNASGFEETKRRFTLDEFSLEVMKELAQGMECDRDH